MSTPHPRLSNPIGGAHLVVLDRRVRDLLLVGLTGLIPLVIALAVTVQVPNPDFFLTFLFVAGGMIVVALTFFTRLEWSVGFLGFYLCCLDGPVKLLTAGGEATAVVRNVLTFAICLGVGMRMLAKRQALRLPPMSGWIVAYVVIVLANVLNPNTISILKSLGGIRDLLQWVPFFFFGYVLIRSEASFRRLFIVIGVLALANGVTATIQTRMSLSTVAAWGPGYKERVFGNEATGKGSRKYNVEGVGRVRPMALGSDSGFGGGVGVIALPCCLALFALWRGRRRWVPALFCLGALLALATGLGRTQFVAGGIAFLFFVVLAASSGRKVTSALKAILIVVALAIPAGVLLVSVVEEKGVFSRYNKISVASTTGEKTASLRQIPVDIEHDPFGFGLGVSGAGSSFGGRTTVTLEGHGFSSETQYNWITDELGLPGLLLWLGLSGTLVVLILRGLPRMANIDIRIAFIGVAAAFLADIVVGFRGPLMESAASGPFFFFTMGMVAYWLVGPGRAVGEHAASPKTSAVEARAAGAV